MLPNPYMAEKLGEQHRQEAMQEAELERLIRQTRGRAGVWIVLTIAVVTAFVLLFG